jgi:DNA gyrase/topoisomerase IV subunit B
MVEDLVEAGRANRQHAVQHVKTDQVELAWCWTNARDEAWHSFVNGSRTPEGGTHVTAVKRAVTNALAGLATKPINPDDLRAGLIVAVHARVQHPQFQGQVKNKLLNRNVEASVYEAVRDPIDQWAKRSSRVVQAVVARAARLRAARDRFDRERDAARGLDAGGRSRALPDQLAAAPDCRPDERELFLVEGQSASGSAKKARDPRYQEVLGLKGKIPNAEQKGRAAMLENEEIRRLVTAVGAGVGDACAVKKSRVGKIMLLMDADPDGQHITALALSFLNRYMGPVVDAGIVWVVRSPLFRAVWRDRTVYGDTLEHVKAKLPKRADPVITRYKGLGECDPADLKFLAMDPATRLAQRVTRTTETSDEIARVMGRQSDIRRLLVGLGEDQL